MLRFARLKMFNQIGIKTIPKKKGYATATGSVNAANQDVTDRYKAKLLEKAQKEGVKNVDELKEKYKDKIQEVKVNMDREDPIKKALEQKESEAAKIADASVKSAIKVPKSDLKELDSFIDIGKFRLHDRKEIEMLWKLRFANNPKNICGLIEEDVFKIIYENAVRYKMFLLPLPKDEGQTEIHFVQFNFVALNTIHLIFTTLAEFKLNQEYARPHTTIVLHTDLLEEKGIVLFNGTVESENVSVQEIHLLVLFIQKFYSAAKGSPKNVLLEAFNKGDSETFSVDKLISEAEVMD